MHTVGADFQFWPKKYVTAIILWLRAAVRDYTVHSKLKSVSENRRTFAASGGARERERERERE